MIKSISITEPDLWDRTVKSFRSYDVYYLSGYVKAFALHGDGEPVLLIYESDGMRAMYVFMKRATYIDGYYDIITPYGYGGVVFDGDINASNLCSFKSEFEKYMRSSNIVSNFVRYHPVLKNSMAAKAIFNVVDIGKTVMVDLASEDLMWTNFTRQNRNKIRKAEKNGVEIFHSKDASLFDDFRIIYDLTMDRDNASGYYYFGEDFYRSIHRDLHDNYEMFYAVYQDKIIAMSIILFANEYMHYHLSGSLVEYRHLAPVNLLLYKVAVWGHESGYKYFHLGGGLGAGEDDLYKFKAAFNKIGDVVFSVGKEIYDDNLYERMVEIRKNDGNFDPASSFFPLYRS